MSSETAMKATNLTLPENINIETVESLAGEFKALLAERHHELLVDVSKVQNITIPGMQLIVALEKSMSAAGGALTLRGDSPAFVAACMDSGLQHLHNVERENG